jgi:hypothetical protein
MASYRLLGGSFAPLIRGKMKKKYNYRSLFRNHPEHAIFA